MEWKDYAERFASFSLSVTTTEALVYMTKRLIENYPNNLPQAQRDAMLEYKEKLLKDPATAKNLEEVWPEFKQDCWSEFEIHFESGVYYQALVMLYAHLDAFITDSIRFACKRELRQLKRQRQISWEDVISCGNWDKLIDELTKRYLFEISLPSTVKRIETVITKHLGINLRFSAETWDFLTPLAGLECMRNLIVHNGGRADEQMVVSIDENEEKDVKVGEQIPVTIVQINSMVAISRVIASELFVEISKKFFGKKESELKFYLWYKKVKPHKGRAK